MEVYLLMEYVQQPDFTDRYGEQACECSCVVGVYSTKEKAEAARQAEEAHDKSLREAYDGLILSEFEVHCMIVN